MQKSLQTLNFKVIIVTLWTLFPLGRSHWSGHLPPIFKQQATSE